MSENVLWYDSSTLGLPAWEMFTGYWSEVIEASQDYFSQFQQMEYSLPSPGTVNGDFGLNVAQFVDLYDPIGRRMGAPARTSQYDRKDCGATVQEISFNNRPFTGEWRFAFAYVVANFGTDAQPNYRAFFLARDMYVARLNWPAQWESNAVIKFVGGVGDALKNFATELLNSLSVTGSEAHLSDMPLPKNETGSIIVRTHIYGHIVDEGHAAQFNVVNVTDIRIIDTIWTIPFGEYLNARAAHAECHDGLSYDYLSQNPNLTALVTLWRAQYEAENKDINAPSVRETQRYIATVPPFARWFWMCNNQRNKCEQRYQATFGSGSREPRGKPWLSLLAGQSAPSTNGEHVIYDADTFFLKGPVDPRYITIDQVKRYYPLNYYGQWI